MISIKKLATVGAAAGLLAASALPVLAWGSDDLDITQKNKAYVKNDITATSNTGGNKIKANDDVKGGKIKTGDAFTGVDVTNVLNSNEATVDSCECFNDVTINQKNKAKVKNYVTADSNTGDNKIKAGDDVKWGKIKTGDAFTGVSVSNILNSNVATVN